jgi:hypothetical protein
VVIFKNKNQLAFIAQGNVGIVAIEMQAGWSQK